jgi:hypothetical protein
MIHVAAMNAIPAGGKERRQAIEVRTAIDRTRFAGTSIAGVERDGGRLNVIHDELSFIVEALPTNIVSVR